MPPVPKPPTATSGRKRTLVVIGAVVVLVVGALVAGSLLIGRGGGSSAAPAATDTTTATTSSLVSGIHQQGTVLGDPKATVAMLQFEDLQCPVCKKYMDNVFPAIVDEYVKPGRVRIDFRGLAFLGPDSEKALRIALAAGRQNKLWDVVELFYQEQGQENSGWVTDATIDKVIAQVPGLDAARVKADAKTTAVTKEIVAMAAQAKALNVPGTPWFFISRGISAPVEFRPSALDPSVFRPALDQALTG
jgi:protein-disulfide isomerase